MNLQDHIVEELRKHYLERYHGWDTAENCHCGERTHSNYDRAAHLASVVMDVIQKYAKF